MSAARLVGPVRPGACRRTGRRMRSPWLLVALSAPALASGCRCSEPGTVPIIPSPSASGSAPEVVSPLDPREVTAVVNGAGAPVYKGPSGRVLGKVRIEGDPPPDVSVKAPAKCREALGTYGKLFRVGPGGVLADAIVGATRFQGYVPEKEDAVKVTIHGCAFDRRTLVLTYGQRIDVFNQDGRESYMPYLDGAPTQAQLVAVPKGAPVRFFPPKPGRYVLKDFLKHDWMAAEVVVLAYATHAVTDLTGAYAIEGLPVGKVTLSAVLPATGSSLDQVVDVKEGDNVVDLVLTYPPRKPGEAPAPGGPASAPPAASASAGPAASASAAASGSAVAPKKP